jgi:hypothetical protein
MPETPQPEHRRKVNQYEREYRGQSSDGMVDCAECANDRGGYFGSHRTASFRYRRNDIGGLVNGI